MNHSSAQQRALKILAKSVYRELKASGYARAEMIAFTTELLDLVSIEAKQNAADGDPDAKQDAADGADAKQDAIGGDAAQT